MDRRDFYEIDPDFGETLIEASLRRLRAFHELLDNSRRNLDDLQHPKGVQRLDRFVALCDRFLMTLENWRNV